jgi:hypothetical protein
VSLDTDGGSKSIDITDVCASGDFCSHHLTQHAEQLNPKFVGRHEPVGRIRAQHLRSSR